MSNWFPSWTIPTVRKGFFPDLPIPHFFSCHNIILGILFEKKAAFSEYYAKSFPKPRSGMSNSRVWQPWPRLFYSLIALSHFKVNTVVRELSKESNMGLTGLFSYSKHGQVIVQPSRKILPLGEDSCFPPTTL